VTPKAVLFDFDGTLADTAADLCAALNALRAGKGLAEAPLDEVRPFASMGARGLLRIGFGVKPEDAEYAALRDAFLEHYDRNVCVATRLFPGMKDTIEKMKERGVAWGIVTNKSSRFTHRIVQGLAVSPDCVVCGDSTPHLKPHPAPLTLAAEQLALAPAQCIYVGDDLRDVQAARAAGMRPVAAAWGYISPDNGGPRSWNAEAVLSEPKDLLKLLAA
jgi:phosphoglycolate phosphatase